MYTSSSPTHTPILCLSNSCCQVFEDGPVSPAVAQTAYMAPSQYIAIHSSKGCHKERVVEGETKQRRMGRQHALAVSPVISFISVGLASIGNETVKHAAHYMSQTT